jgi:hypothetical protein
MAAPLGANAVMSVAKPARRKKTPERVIFGAGVLALCWSFPRQPAVLIFGLAAMSGLVGSALRDTAADVEREGRGRILAKIAGCGLLDALAAYGCARTIPLLPPLLMILAEFVAAFVFVVVPFVMVGCLVVVLFADRAPAPARNRVEGGRR